MVVVCSVGTIVSPIVVLVVVCSVDTIVSLIVVLVIICSVDTVVSPIVVLDVICSVSDAADRFFYYVLGGLLVIFLDIATAVLRDTADRLEAS